MKIPTKQLSFDEVMALPSAPELTPKRPNALFRFLMRMVGSGDLKATHFHYTQERMDEAGPGPYLILMNHSSFIDLSIAAEVFKKTPYCIVCTSDGFVGKPWLMRQLGCIPTKKFVTSFSLIGEMQYALKELKTSILMYPEASYSFDGTATPLPRKMGVLLKRLGVPVISVHTSGAFARDPLYNMLQKRNVDVSAEIRCLFTKEELSSLSVSELDEKLNEAFTFDNFAWQQENKVEISEPFRADGLERILFQCASCKEEGQMEGKGTTLTCKHCGKTYQLNPYGLLEADDGTPVFSHIPEWYAWERENIKQTIQNGTYQIDTDVEIGIMKDYKAIYMVGEGHLVHDENGFTLTGCEGKLHYEQSPLSSYSLYADYFWYELGDIICIGTQDILYYCFPKQKDVVAKARIATEELYKLKKKSKNKE